MSEQFSSSLRAIYKVNLGVKKTERVLVFTDRASREKFPAPEELLRRLRLRDIAALTAEAGRTLSKEVIYFEYPDTGSHGQEPPVILWEEAFGGETVRRLKLEKLLGPILGKKAKEKQIKRAEKIIHGLRKNAVQVVIALSNYSTSHTMFRDFLSRLCGTRYASMPLFDVSMLEGPMAVDWKALEKTTRLIAKAVNKAEEIEVETPNGTNMKFSKKGRIALADTGNLRRAGSFGNLPAGEVYLAPLEGTAHGRLVLEWAPTRRFSFPVVLSIKNGEAVDVSGSDEYATYLRGKLSERRENANIAEFGIGTNPKARRPDNILEAEKILGTVHIALGDNSTFGGVVKTPFHQDFVFFRPTVWLVDGKGNKEMLMKEGKIWHEIR